MSEQPRKATMAEAKSAWDAFEGKRSIRKVVDALAEQGLKVTVSTLQRWKDADWLTTNADKRARAAQTARKTGEKISAKTEDMEGKLTRLEIIEREEREMKAERERLMHVDMLDSELARLAMRESLVAQIVLARQITRRAAIIAEIAPEIAAKLMDVLKQPAASTTIIIPPNEVQQGINGDDAKVVNGRTLPQKSESQLAIEAFRNRRSQEVAA